MVISAVITADIVNSTLLTGAAEKKFKDKITGILKPFRFEFYRGDSFQVLIKDPRQALTIILQIRAEARRVSPLHDVRCSIGIGRVNPYLKKLNTATDPAFILSGRSFDTLANTDDRLIISCSEATINHGLKAVGYFVDYLFKNLTEKQSEVLAELLRDNTQLGIAKKLRKSRSTINKHAQSAGWHELLRLMEEYDNLVSIILHGNNLAD